VALAFGAQRYAMGYGGTNEGNIKQSNQITMQVQGVISKVLEPVTGQTKDGSEWKKLIFVVSNNEGHNNTEQLFAFEIFGAEKVDNFQKYNSVGSSVNVEFNIRTNEHQGKYYTSLQAWRVFAVDFGVVEQPTAAPIDEADDLPF
jgi:hypothetical protein